MVQSRDHVLIASFCMPCFSTFARRRRSTYGPFFSDRLMLYLRLLYSGPAQCKNPARVTGTVHIRRRIRGRPVAIPLRGGPRAVRLARNSNETTRFAPP